ncbi:G-type lectin S-receptor-like serine/threonine-protein kinase At1g11330 [Silene latifolia]|uniref:G-type lectin S-receptor-like serine/threonine-protein kinase At1g11330 n=1 Tax=Silene latifolia TaxID=37657 RepID=UPI003D7707EF
MYQKVVIYIFLLISCFEIKFASTTSDAIITTQFLKDPEELVSSNGNFKLGFFRPTNSTYRYLGIWDDGQQIAVKRLSRASGQGLQEFMNEVELISKLQHKNLVRLFGCCVEGEEKLLVYELLPNKSLDAILFDPVHRRVLNWQKRFEIIQGICRGLLYLHRDSRLRIIHRDLKNSFLNITLDVTPKILVK